MDLKINHRPSLAELQRWMKWIVTEPRGVDQALADQLGDPDTLQHFIKNQTPQTTADRLSIYAEAYFLRILESAKNDFPITFSILGDLNFQKMIADYLKVYPSRTSNIGEVGQHLPRFVRHYYKAFDFEMLPDVVDLDWAAIQSFYSKEMQPLNLNELATWTEEQWEKVQFQIHPSVHLIQSKWPLDELRSQSRNLKSQDPENNLNLKMNSELGFFQLARIHGVVLFKRLFVEEFLVLKNLKNGLSLASALNQVLSEFPECGEHSDKLSENIMGFTASWIRDGIIAGFNRGGQRP